MNTEIYEFDGFCLDAVQMVLLREGEKIPIQPKISEVLLLLLRKKGEIGQSQNPAG